MMKTRWCPPAVRGFELLFRPWMHRRLAGIHLAGIPREWPSGRSVILAANHVSWWDGFLLREIHRRCVPSVPLITLMQEDELERVPFFRWMGVVGVSTSPSSARRALRTLRSFRDRHALWLSIFPQGRIWPSWKRPLGFRQGIRAVSQALAPAAILPVGLHLEGSTKPGPVAYVAVGEPMDVAADALPSIADVEERVADVLDRIYGMVAAYGETAPEHWPPVHASLPEPAPEVVLPARSHQEHPFHETNDAHES